MITTDRAEPVPRPAPGFGARLYHLFFSPERLFRELGERPPWVAPLLLGLGVKLVALLALPTSVYVEAIRRGAATDPTISAVGPDAALTALFVRIAGVADVLVGHPVALFALAGLVTLAFARPGPLDVRFRENLSLAAHALLIPAAGALATVPLQVLTEDPGLRLTLAAFTPFLEGASLPLRVLAGIDLFSLWMLAVVAVGVPALDPRRSWTSTFVPLALLYLGYAAARALALGWLVPGG